MRIKINLAHPARWREPVEVEDALIDTGASFTTLPRGLAEQLKLEVFGQQTARTAAGPITVDVSSAFLEFDGRRTVTPVWISDTYPGVLIGVFTLEALGLAVDPATGKLTESEFLLLAAVG